MSFCIDSIIRCALKSKEKGENCSVFSSIAKIQVFSNVHKKITKFMSCILNYILKFESVQTSWHLVNIQLPNRSSKRKTIIRRDLLHFRHGIIKYKS